MNTFTLLDIGLVCIFFNVTAAIVTTQCDVEMEKRKSNVNTFVLVLDHGFLVYIPM